MTFDGLGRYRRGLQLALGVVWLLDAALQFQPYMFTTAFSHDVLAPSATGNPEWIAGPVRWAATTTSHHPVSANAAFATAQLLIALGLFTKATVRLALVGSVVWALGVWWLGEGLGGLLVTAQSPVADSPGAALLYALVSIAIWPTTRPLDRQATELTTVAAESPLRPVGSRILWLALWLGFAVECLQAANRTPSALSDMIAGMAEGEPTWLVAVDQHTAGWLAGHGTPAAVTLAALFAVIGLSVFAHPAVTRGILVGAGALAATIWLVGQDLGEIATGQATDPNTGPLLILLAAVYWPIATHPATAPREVDLESLFSTSE
jgi:hypothetical protein